MRLLEAIELTKIRQLTYKDFPIVCKSETVAHSFAQGESLLTESVLYVIKTRNHKEPWIVIEKEEAVESIVAAYHKGKKLKS